VPEQPQEARSAACSLCGDEDSVTRPFLTDEGLMIFVCPDCESGENE
jgi:hypothetical protein